jgi:hypothetical protein
VVVYELLDELMDFGFPQTTDSKILQEWVTPAHLLTCLWLSFDDDAAPNCGELR